MQKLKKKGAVDLTELAVGIVILGIIVSIGAVILHKQAITQIESTAVRTIANESLVPTQGGAALSKTWVKGITTVYNATGNIPVASTNYISSINPDTGVLTLSNSTCSTGPAVANITCSNWLVNYQVYNITDPRYLVPSQAEIGLSEYGNWFKILVIVGCAAIVLALIFMAFGKGKGEASIGQSY